VLMIPCRECERGGGGRHSGMWSVFVLMHSERNNAEVAFVKLSL
jgi:hypothetical protein